MTFGFAAVDFARDPEHQREEVQHLGREPSDRRRSPDNRKHVRAVDCETGRCLGCREADPRRVFGAKLVGRPEPTVLGHDARGAVAHEGRLNAAITVSVTAC